MSDPQSSQKTPQDPHTSQDTSNPIVWLIYLLVSLGFFIGLIVWLMVATS